MRIKLFTWSTIVLLLAALVAEHYADRVEGDLHNRVVSILERQLKAEALLGSQLPSGVREFATPNRRHSLYWIVNVVECAACTSDRTNWNALAADTSINTIIVVASGSDAYAHTQVAAFLSEFDATTVKWVDIDFAAKQFGHPFASLRLIVDERDMIISVDARLPDGNCRWSYAAQAAALLIPSLNLPIRVTPDTVLALRTTYGW